MTIDQAGPAHRGVKSRIYVWHPIAILVFLAVAYFASNLLAQSQNPAGPVHGDVTKEIVLILAVTLVLLVVEVVGLSIAIYRHDRARLLWQALAIGLLVASLVFARPIGWAVQYVNLLIFPGVFRTCEEGARPYGDGHKLNLCSAQSFGSSFTAIAFDSGGEIAHAASEQTASFRAALKTQKSPVLSECAISPGHKLRGSFYLVDSDCDRRPEPY